MLNDSPRLAEILQSHKTAIEEAVSRGEKLDSFPLWCEWGQVLEEYIDDGSRRRTGTQKLLQQAAKRLYPPLVSISPRCLHIGSLRRAFLNKDKLNFTPLSVTKSDVSVAELDGKRAIVRKRYDSELGVIVAARLSRLCDDSGVRFVPYLCGWEEGDTPDSFVSYSEYIEGVGMEEAITSGELQQEDLCHIMIVLHGLLEWLWAKTGFVHGDLYSHNIILRRCKKGEMVPVMSTDGTVAMTIRSKYYPVLIDFELSSMSDCSRWHEDVSPMVTPLVDILSLYSDLSVVPRWELEAVDAVKSLSPFDGCEYPSPCGVEVLGLTHRELLELYREL